MPQTKAQVLATLQAQFDAALIDPNITDKRHLVGQLTEVGALIEQLNPTTNGGGTSPADITQGIDASTDIDLIKDLLTQIKLELVNSKSIADLLIQDSGTTPRYFIRQDAIDQTTGTTTTTILNLDGTIPSPVPVLPLVPVKAGATNQVKENLYIPIIAGTGYAIGDSLSNVKLLSGETGLIVASLWYNLTSGVTIASPPPIANLKGYEDKVEELLVDIRANIDNLVTNRLLYSEIVAALDSQTTGKFNSILAKLDEINIDRLIPLNIAVSGINTNQITQDKVAAAIDGAVDINTILTRLQSIDNKTVAAAPTTKTTIVGFTSIANTNNNLLDPTGAGAWTDVRAYQSCELSIEAGLVSFGFTGLIGATDSTGSNPALITAFNPGNLTINIATSLSGTAKLKLRYDLTGVSFVRFGATLSQVGNKVTGVFSGFATANQITAQIAGTVPVVSVGNTIVTVIAPQQLTEISSTITASATSAPFLTQPGQSYQISINVTAITGALAQSIARIQESLDAGTTWRTVYVFEEITVAKTARQYRSPVLIASGNRYRYTETVTGTKPSISRTFTRSTINAPGLVNQDTRSSTIYNANLAAIDTPAYGVIRAITLMSTVATPIWLQIHDALIPVVSGAIPRQCFRIPVDGLTLGAAYFGNGRQLGSAIDPRITISTTANTYTPISLAANTVQLYVEAN